MLGRSADWWQHNNEIKTQGQHKVLNWFESIQSYQGIKILSGCKKNVLAKGIKTKQATAATVQMTYPKIRTTVSPKSSTPERHAIGLIGTMLFTPLEPFVSNLGQYKGYKFRQKD